MCVCVCEVSSPPLFVLRPEEHPAGATTGVQGLSVYVDTEAAQLKKYEKNKTRNKYSATCVHRHMAHICLRVSQQTCAFKVNQQMYNTSCVFYVFLLP